MLVAWSLKRKCVKIVPVERFFGPETLQPEHEAIAIITVPPPDQSTVAFHARPPYLRVQSASIGPRLQGSLVGSKIRLRRSQNGWRTKWIRTRFCSCILLPALAGICSMLGQNGRSSGFLTTRGRATVRERDHLKRLLSFGISLTLVWQHTDGFEH